MNPFIKKHRELLTDIALSALAAVAFAVIIFATIVVSPIAIDKLTDHQTAQRPTYDNTQY